jgi:hypothetical protein
MRTGRFTMQNKAKKATQECNNVFRTLVTELLARIFYISRIKRDNDPGQGGERGSSFRYVKRIGRRPILTIDDAQ